MIMKFVKKLIWYFLMPLISLALLLAGTLYVRYGGGQPYPDVSTAPILPADSLQVYFQYDEPVGNVAASRDTTYPTRVFMTVHPESRPKHWKVLEITGGVARPYPNEDAQQSIFTTVLGLYVDNQNRLWTIDHGNHGYWYLADSDIPDQMLQSKEYIAQHKPYFVFRFKQ